ncbi:unnamed protein product [Cyclocybe aegerita]|uniref:Xylanolytic transcriptional activator regulatory domain-containing protein n=1 Tax=Cyclocybe aegerita TaxID=1973307 RepID=A0A8S0XZ56_CYCAE|nr:unnamed protein product [Cyclocybe aegerita]
MSGKGPELPTTQCANCIRAKIDCTYIEAPPRRSSSKKYIASLEDRITDLDLLLRKLCPNEKTYQDWISTIMKSGVAFDDVPEQPPSSILGTIDYAQGLDALESFANAIRAANDAEPTSQSDEESPNAPFIDSSLDSNRFFGKSSSEVLIREAIFTKKSWVDNESSIQRPVLHHRREEFWALRTWERALEPVQHNQYTFPEPELSKELLNLYFEHINLHFPLLHRPSFERALRDNLQYSNASFGAVYLLVCAIGARFSNDPRVLFNGSDSYQSAGWKWYNQVETGTISYLSLPSLYDLQLHCLTLLFLQSSSAPQSVWAMVGVVLRSAQDVGIHRLRSRTPSAEDELWKRAFWVLICIDRVVSTALGRPGAIQDEDFDLDLPIDCDDEYWEHPDPQKRFKQPADKPSTMSGFHMLLKLMYILNCCIRGFYAPPKGDEWYNPLSVHEWKPRIVMELDSSLNKWLDSVPEHLRWDPNRQNMQHFNISAMLHVLYYHIQILTHRLFIASPRKPSVVPFPSLTICTNAARACVRIVDMQRQRNGIAPPPVIQLATFTSGVVLLFSSWVREGTGGGRPLASRDADDMILVEHCLQTLKASEKRWTLAGRFWDVLEELSSMGDRTNMFRDNESPTDSIPAFAVSEGIGTSLDQQYFNSTALQAPTTSFDRLDTTSLLRRLSMDIAQPLSPTLSSLFSFTFAYPGSPNDQYQVPLAMDAGGIDEFAQHDQLSSTNTQSSYPTPGLEDWDVYLAGMNQSDHASSRQRQ